MNTSTHAPAFVRPVLGAVLSLGLAFTIAPQASSAPADTSAGVVVAAQADLGVVEGTGQASGRILDIGGLVKCVLLRRC